MKSYFNDKIKDLIQKEIKKSGEKNFGDEEIREIVAETMLKFYKILFYKRTYWYNEIKKK